MKMFRTRFCIVKNKWDDLYRIHYRYWWCPFWITLDRSFARLEAATEYLFKYKSKNTVVYEE